MDFLIPADAIGGEPAITERLLVMLDGRPMMDACSVSCMTVHLPGIA